MSSSDPVPVISFNTTKDRKRLAKMLAARLDKPDLTTLMNYLLDKEVARYFSPEVQRELLSSPDEDESPGESERPKAGSDAAPQRRRAKAA